MLDGVSKARGHLGCKFFDGGDAMTSSMHCRSFHVMVVGSGAGSLNEQRLSPWSSCLAASLSYVKTCRGGELELIKEERRGEENEPALRFCPILSLASARHHPSRWLKDTTLGA
jgi:hypothetical protein